MTDFTLSDLSEMFRECAEPDESVVLINEHNAARAFDDLGIDSLALFNVLAHIKQKLAVRVDYDDLMMAKTPNALLRLVQSRIMA